IIRPCPANAIRCSASLARSRHDEAPAGHRAGKAGLVPAPDQRIAAQYAARAKAAIGHYRIESERHRVSPAFHSGGARPGIEARHLATEQWREIDIDAGANGIAPGRRVAESEPSLNFAKRAALPSRWGASHSADAVEPKGDRPESC